MTSETATRNPAQGVVRVAAIADIHYGRHTIAPLGPLFNRISEAADVLLVGGDLTDHGDPDEARGLAREVQQHLRIPLVAVLGNHDFESARVPEITEIFRAAGMIILDGDAYEIGSVGIAGVKGFCGGFGPRALGPWGEPIVKSFVQETLNEALKLETALARLRASDRLVLLHYAPTASTVAGEPLEIFPYLGSSRLEEPMVRYGVSAVFHGHAHHGQAKGALSNGTPVYNVSQPLLTRLRPDEPFELLEFRTAPRETQT